jgi:hypothetical protein
MEQLHEYIVSAIKAHTRRHFSFLHREWLTERYKTMASQKGSVVTSGMNIRGGSLSVQLRPEPLKDPRQIQAEALPQAEAGKIGGGTGENRRISPNGDGYTDTAPTMDSNVSDETIRVKQTDYKAIAGSYGGSDFRTQAKGGCDPARGNTNDIRDGKGMGQFIGSKFEKQRPLVVTVDPTTVAD